MTNWSLEDVQGGFTVTLMEALKGKAGIADPLWWPGGMNFQVRKGWNLSSDWSLLDVGGEDWSLDFNTILFILSFLLFAFFFLLGGRIHSEK